MDVSCPYCELSVAVADEQQREEIVCPSCGSSFKAEPGTTSTWSPRKDQRLLGRFELIDHIGMGAFGTVYKARDPELDRIVAIKVLRAAELASKEDIDRFLREARSVAQLRHPGIVPVFEVGKADDLPFLVSEYVDGVTLADQSTARRLTYDQAAETIESVARALEYAHGQGVIHRDVKPANIILGEDGQPRLMDFGLAKRDMGEITMTVDGQVIGTPAYMSPEQASGHSHTADGRSDIYSLGVILYWLLTGRLPFRGNSRMLIFQVQRDEPPSPRKHDRRIPRDLETICLKAMSKDPNHRYFTAHGLAEDLRRYRNGEPIHARRVTPITRLWRWCRRKPAVAGLCVSLMTLAISISVLAILVVNQRVTGPLSTFLDDTLPAERRLEALEDVSLNEPAIVLQVLEALERAPDDDFVGNGLRTVSSEPIAAGWSPEAFEHYARLVLSPNSTIKLIADLSSGAVDEDLMSAMLVYFDRLDLSTLDKHERAGVLRALIAILGENPNGKIVSRCCDIFDSLGIEELVQWLFKADSGIELEEIGELSLVRYTAQFSNGRAEKIGEYIEDRVVELAKPNSKGDVAASRELKYFVRAIGEIQPFITNRFREATKAVHALLREPEQLDDLTALETLIESFVLLYDDDESQLDAIRKIMEREDLDIPLRRAAVIAAGRLHDAASISPLQALAFDESVDLMLREAALLSLGQLGKYMRQHGGPETQIQQLRKGLRELAERIDREGSPEVARAVITAFGDVAKVEDAKVLFRLLLHERLNATTTGAIQTIILEEPQNSGEMVVPFLHWYLGAPRSNVTVPPTWVLTRLDAHAQSSIDAKNEAKAEIKNALARASNDDNAKIRKLAKQILDEMPAIAAPSRSGR